jgi:hypothetical protein
VITNQSFSCFPHLSEMEETILRFFIFNFF